MYRMIGPRILKTGMAIAGSLYVSELFGIPGTFSAVVALLAVKPTVKASIRYGRTLLIACIVAALVGISAGFFLNANFWTIGIASILVMTLLKKVEFDRRHHIGRCGYDQCDDGRYAAEN
jgi:uncharacterized membrane protein YgaE (UPF0421/DUF939 family)